MQYIGYSKPKLLIADKGKKIRAKNDVYEAEHLDDIGNIIPTHEPYYATVIFLGDQISSLNECQEIYVEEDI